jgi:hypothetical protein
MGDHGNYKEIFMEQTRVIVLSAVRRYLLAGEGL